MSDLKDPLKAVADALRLRGDEVDDEVDVVPPRGSTSCWGTRVIRGTAALKLEEVRAILIRVLRAQYHDEQRWRELAQAWSPICDRAGVLGPDLRSSGVGIALVQAARMVSATVTCRRACSASLIVAMADPSAIGTS